MNRKKIICSIFICIILLTTGYHYQKRSTLDENHTYTTSDGTISEYSQSIRKNVSYFQVSTFDNVTLDSNQLMGKPTVLYFWNSYCSICRQKASATEKIYKNFNNKINFYGVNMKDNKDSVHSFTRNYNITYKTFYDPEGRIIRALDSSISPQAVPATIILDKDGKVAARILGASHESTINSIINKVQYE